MNYTAIFLQCQLFMQQYALFVYYIHFPSVAMYRFIQYAKSRQKGETEEKPQAGEQVVLPPEKQYYVPSVGRGFSVESAFFVLLYFTFCFHRKEMTTGRPNNPRNPNSRKPMNMETSVMMGCRPS